ncbi:unnamed protein product [Durusdinium trenchii]
MLNPAPMAPTERCRAGAGGSWVAAKVTHSTQLVLLGQFPSLGYCSSRKKDGQPCSMPCDKEKTGGKLVCFYHTMHQEAQKVRILAGLNKSPSGATDSSVTSGLVIPNQRGATMSHRATIGDRADPAMVRLLGALPRPPTREGKTTGTFKANSAGAPSATKPTARPAGSPVLAPPTIRGGREDDTPAVLPEGAQQAQQVLSAAEKKILAMFPEGLPMVDPNRPMESRLHLEALKASHVGARPPATVHHTPTPLAKAESTSRGAAPRQKRRGTTSDTGDGLPKTKTTSGASFQKLESALGRKAATFLSAGSDPRKDLVRQQSSRFQSAVEEERAAKRMRRLCELEQLDFAQEQMEELKSMKVKAFRCKSCYITFDQGSRQRLWCQEQGHELISVEATKTRWECRSCRASEEVLGRQLPKGCARCGADTWKQVSLRKLRRRAPMERELLLPRGEELPFLNSIHIPELQGARAWKPSKEAADDYEGL